MIKTIVLSGGGSAAIVIHLSVLKYLEDEAKRLKLRRVQRFHGTSAGAIVAFLLACGKTPGDVLRVFEEEPTVFARLLDCHVDNIVRATAAGHAAGCYGLSDGRLLRGFLNEWCHTSTGLRNPTFRAFFDTTGVSLRVVATDVCEAEGVCFSEETTPDMRVLDGVLASSALPVLFAPLRLVVDGVPRLFVDGGLAENFPVGHTSGVGFSDPQTTFGICLCEGPAANADAVIANVGTYAWKLVLATIMVNQRDKTRPPFPVCNVPHGASTNYILTAETTSHLVATATLAARDVATLLPEVVDDDEWHDETRRRQCRDQGVQTDSHVVGL